MMGELYRFSMWGREYAFATWAHGAWLDAVEEEATELEARSVVRAAAADVFGRLALHDALADLGSSPVDDLEERALSALSGRWLRVGVVRVLELGVATDYLTAPEPELEPETWPPPEVAPERSLDHWIEIELVDEDGAPVPFERYELIAADGRRRSGQLDERGFARVEPLDETSYDLRFPNLPPDACSRA